MHECDFRLQAKKWISVFVPIRSVFANSVTYDIIYGCTSADQLSLTRHGSHPSMKLINIYFTWLHQFRNYLYFYSRDPVLAYSWCQGNKLIKDIYPRRYTVGSACFKTMMAEFEGIAPPPDEIDNSSLASKKCVVFK